MTDARTLIEELVETIDKLPGTIGGKWKLGYTGSDIGCENEKIGGFAKLLDIRGWGYLTGTGHGALGLSQDEGAVVQRLYSQHVINCSPDNIRTIAEEFRKLEAERDELRKALKPFAYIGGNEALTESLQPGTALTAYDGNGRKFALDWSCYLAARLALNATREDGE